MSQTSGVLTGRVAFVTGGASGIGAACVRALHAQGATVAIADRDFMGARALADELGPSADAFELDVLDPESVAAAVDSAVERFGALHLAVNSAGVGVPHPSRVGELAFDAWRRVVGVNLDGVFLSMHAEIGAMLRGGEGGAIVNIASVMASVGTVGASAYVAAKHGVVGLTKAAALEYAAHGIRVNAISPGHIETPMFLAHTDDERAAITSAYPVGRIGRPHEVGDLACYLLGPNAAFANGACWALDGGYTAQ